MKVIVDSSRYWGPNVLTPLYKYNDTDVDTLELCKIRKLAHDYLMPHINWDDYDPIYTHIVYYAEYNNETVYVYTDIELYTDETFERFQKPDIGIVGAFHRR